MARSALWSFVLSGREAEEVPSPISPRGWQLALRALDLAFAVIVALAVVEVITTTTSESWAKPVALTALGVLVLAYLLLGRQAIAGSSQACAVGYLVVLVLAVGALARTAPDTLFIFFIAYPQVWFIVERPRPGVFWTMLLVAASSVGLALESSATGASVAGAVASQGVGLAFSLLFGTWTSGLLAQGRRQADLIAELQRTQAELAAAHHERGVLAERERVAREVHDTLAQGYTSIVMLAQSAVANLAEHPDAARERLALIEEVARDNLREARAVVAALMPVELDGRTLRDALAALADRFGRETGIPVTLSVDTDTGGLRRDEQVVLLRTAQETLSNTRRHADAHAVSMRLRRAEGRLVLDIRDDGVGFDADAPAGNGLVGLRRRLDEVGGTLQIETAPGRGTRVVATMVAGT
jgi:signal transduction histidine kinase